MRPITCLNRDDVLITVHVDGKPVPIYLAPDGMPFIEGMPGKPYAIYIENKTSGRLEILASVDGMNTLKKEPANWRSNRGMVVDGRSTWRNLGWRLNDNEVAEFKFADMEASIAARAGEPQNIGVIGIATFSEKSYMRPISDSGYSPKSFGGARGMSMNSMGSMKGGDATMDWMESSRERSVDIGTGAGEQRHDAVGRTSFTRATDRPASIIEIQYRTRPTLERLGLLRTYPQAFAGEEETGYRELTTK